MADIFVLKMHENYLIFNVFLHEYTYLKAGIFNIQYLMVCVFEDEYRAGGLRVEQLRINAYSYQAVFQETIEKKFSPPLFLEGPNLQSKYMETDTKTETKKNQETTARTAC